MHDHKYHECTSYHTEESSKNLRLYDHFIKLDNNMPPWPNGNTDRIFKLEEVSGHFEIKKGFGTFRSKNECIISYSLYMCLLYRILLFQSIMVWDNHWIYMPLYNLDLFRHSLTWYPYNYMHAFSYWKTRSYYHIEFTCWFSSEFICYCWAA